MHASRLTATTMAVVILAGSAVALAAGDPTPDPPPRIAVVARGDGTNFADALAVGSVAGQLGAPVFTTPATSLAPATAAALASYNPELVIITGGTAAITADVEAAIEQATDLPADKVVRAAGKDRFETAAAIAAIFDDLGIDAAYLPVGATATDSDLLDGMDATAFLGANATAKDADLLDGLDSTHFQPAGDYVTMNQAAAFGPKFVSLNVYADPALNFDDRYADLADSGVGGLNMDVDFNFTIPPDHTPGTPLTVRLLAYARNAPCNSALLTNWTFITRSGVGDVGDGTSSLAEVDPGLQSFAEDRVPHEFLYTLDSTTGLAPGDAVGFGVFNSGPAENRCDLIATGAAVYYE